MKILSTSIIISHPFFGVRLNPYTYLATTFNAKPTHLQPKMKLTALTPLLFTTLALASPAPVPRPDAAPAAQPPTSHDQLGALVSRLAAIVPDIHPRASGSGGSSGGGGGKSGGSSGSSGSKSSGSSSSSKNSSNKDSDSDSSSSSGGGSSSGSTGSKSSGTGSKTGKSGNATNSNAASSVSPSTALQLGVFGFVAVEVVMQLS
jgi:hypothetical protein